MRAAFPEMGQQVSTFYKKTPCLEVATTYLSAGQRSACSERCPWPAGCRRGCSCCLGHHLFDLRHQTPCGCSASPDPHLGNSARQWNGCGVSAATRPAGPCKRQEERWIASSDKNEHKADPELKNDDKKKTQGSWISEFQWMCFPELVLGLVGDGHRRSEAEGAPGTLDAMQGQCVLKMWPRK